MSPKGGGKPQLGPKTPFQENFIGNLLGAPKSQVGEGVVWVFFFSSFHSKAFLHMTQTSLNFPKLQSLPMAQPQSGGENVRKKKKKFVSQLTLCFCSLKELN